MKRLALLILLLPPLANAQPPLPAIYRAEVGVREATGHNDGPRVAQYLAATGQPAGLPWCAAFVDWCHQQAGEPSPRSAWCPAWFTPARTLWKRTGTAPYTPRPADVFGIYYPALGRIAHVGFIDGAHGQMLLTVEGNTNDRGARLGDGVYRRRRPARTLYAVARWAR